MPEWVWIIIAGALGITSVRLYALRRRDRKVLEELGQFVMAARLGGARSASEGMAEAVKHETANRIQVALNRSAPDVLKRARKRAASGN